MKIIELNSINKSQFYKKTGLSNGFLDKVKDVGASKIEDILKTFPEISAEWLIMGIEPMIKANHTVAEPVMSYRKTKDPLYELQRIPVYNLDATMGLVPVSNTDGIDQEKIVDYISLGMLPSCDGATPATGDSMYPLLKAGDIVAYKTIDVDRNNIFFGEMYLLSIYIDETATMKTIKFVQPSDLGTDYIKLVSHNQHHADKEVKISQIAAMALVRASIRIHN